MKDVVALPSPSPIQRPFRAWLLVAMGAFLLMTTAFLGGRPSVFFDSDGYHLMGENLTQVIKRLPAAFSGDHAALHTPVSDDDDVDIATMGARSPFYGLLLYASDRVGGIWLLAALQSATIAWMLFLLWRSAAPTAPDWSYVAMMAALTAGSTLPFFATFVMPDVFASVAAVCFALTMLYAQRLALWERVAVFAIMTASYSFHTSHSLTALAALMPTMAMLAAFKAPARSIVVGAGLVVLAVALAVGGGKLCELGFKMRTGHDLGRPPFLMARILADGPGRVYLRKVCVGPDRPYVACRFRNQPLTRSDDILWEDAPKLGAFIMLKPEEQILMEKQELDFVKASILSDPGAQLVASLRNWARQMVKFSAHDPLRDPRAFLANEYWKTTRIVDMIPDARACKPIGPGCRPPLEAIPVKTWHTVIIALAGAFGLWRFSRPDIRQAIGERTAPWSDERIRLIALTLVLMGLVIINAGVCGVISGAFARYQARIVWLLPAAALLVACGIGPAWPAGLKRRFARTRPRARPREVVAAL